MRGAGDQAAAKRFRQWAKRDSTQAPAARDELPTVVSRGDSARDTDGESVRR